MRVLYREITEDFNPVVDFGDSWGRINDHKKPLFQISKKEEPNWLIAFVSKWMQEPENLTEFGKYYISHYYSSNKKKKAILDDLIELDKLEYLIN